MKDGFDRRSWRLAPAWSWAVVALALAAASASGGARSGLGAVPAGRPACPKGAAQELAGRGRALFLGSCAHCHGADARGDEGPDLHEVELSDSEIADLITHGVPHEMPSFAKKHGAADIAALTAYIRSLK
jgi:mono/diheme cytochrome c family protein